MMHLKAWIFALLSCFAVLSMFGQSSTKKENIELIGKVTDTDGKDLIGVTIYKNDKNQQAEATTDIFGIFSVSANRGDRLIFVMNGYIQTEYVVVSNTGKIDIHMKSVEIKEVHPFATELSTAGKSPQQIGDIPASIVLITKEDILSLGYTSVEDILMNVPGLYGIEENDWTGQGPVLGVRGFYSSGMNNNLVIMVNGVNQLEDYWGFYPLSKLEVPIEAIDRVEIIRGPMSVNYGSGAFFGAVNIITNDNPNNSSNKKVSGSINGSYGWDNSFRATTNIKKGTDKGYFSFSAGVNYSAGLNQDFSKMLAPEYSSSFGSTKGLFEDLRSFINLSAHSKHFYFNLNLTQADKEMFIGKDADTIDLTIPTGDGNIAHLLGGNSQLGYTNSELLDSILTLDIRIGYFAHRSFSDYTASGNSYGFSSFFSNALESEMNAIWKLKKIRTELTTGLYYRRALGLHTTFDFLGNSSSTNSLIRLSDNQAKENYGVMLSATSKISSKLELVGGLRMEYIPTYQMYVSLGNIDASNVLLEGVDQFEQAPIFIPRAAIIYKPNENHIFKGMYGVAHKQPSFGQNSDIALRDDVNDLTASTIKTTEINYIANFYNPKKTSVVTTNVSLFYNQLNELINRTSGYDTALYYISQNSGVVSTFGAELSGKWQILDSVRRLSIGLSITYQNSKLNRTYLVTDTNNPENAIEKDIPYLSFSPKLLGYLTIQYNFTKTFGIGIKSRYVGAMYNEFDITESASLGEAVGYLGNEQVGDYFLFDINLMANNLFKNRIDVSFKIQNVLNTEYHHPITRNNSWVENGFLGRERWGMLTVRYKIK